MGKGLQKGEAETFFFFLLEAAKRRNRDAVLQRPLEFLYDELQYCSSGVQDENYCKDPKMDVIWPL